MGFEQIPNIDKKRKELDKEHAELDNKEYTTPDDIEEKKKIEEEHQKLSDQVKEIEKGKGIKENDEKRRELDEKHERLANKDFKTPEDIEEIARIEKEHKQLSEQSKEIDGKKEKEEKKEFPELSDIELPEDEKIIKALKNKKEEYSKRIEEQIRKDPHFSPDVMPDFYYRIAMLKELLTNKKINAEELSKKLKKEYGGLLNNRAFCSSYSVIKDYVETGGKNLEGGTGLKIEEELKSESREEEAEEKKENEKNQPKRKRAKAKDIKWEKTEISKEEADKVLKGTKEKSKKETGGKEKKGKKDLEKMGVLSTMEKILQDPEALSKIFHEAFEISKNPEVQGKFQELKDVVKKIIEEKKEAPSSVKNAKDFIKKEIEKKEGDDKEKKESPWKTVFGAAGWGILLFLILFMLAELKGIDYFSGQAAGKKKEKK